MNLVKKRNFFFRTIFHNLYIRMIALSCYYCTCCDYVSSNLRHHYVCKSVVYFYNKKLTWYFLPPPPLMFSFRGGKSSPLDHQFICTLSSTNASLISTANCYKMEHLFCSPKFPLIVHSPSLWNQPKWRQVSVALNHVGEKREKNPLIKSVSHNGDMGYIWLNGFCRTKGFTVPFCNKAARFIFP